MPEAAVEYEHPRLLLGEGPEDVSFFHALIRQRNLPNFHISHTGKDRSSSGGHSQFGAKLRTLQFNSSFRKTVKRVVIVTDCDEDPTHSFDAVCQQIQSAGYPVPHAPYEPAEAGGMKLAVAMIPRDTPGNLECYLADAAKAPRPEIAAHVDHFMNMTAIGADWTDPKKGKLWLRAFVAARWPRDPCINIAPMFADANARSIVPTNHSSFDPMVTFLTEFCQ